MSEEKKEKMEEKEEKQYPHFFRYRYPSRYGYDWHRSDYLVRRRMWMNFVNMSLDEEIKLLESVKERYEKRLETINERLTKLKS